MIWAVLGVCALGIVAACGVFAYASNVETPKYTVVEADGAIEIRDYPPMIAAQITRTGPRGEAVRSAFSPLAGYIFAKKRDGDKIAMTAPVTQSGGDEAWTVRFIMPSQYTLETLPKPEGAEVSLVPIPSHRKAAVQFSGVADDALLTEKEAALRAWLARRGLPDDGAATYAYYNDPFTPGFLRRNEVLIELSSP